MKRIIRTEEIVDFFCSREILKLDPASILNKANRMIAKQNRQAEIDNSRSKIEVSDKLAYIGSLAQLKHWMGIKTYLSEKLRGTEYETIYFSLIDGKVSAKELQLEFYISESKYYKILAEVYRLAERYLYYNNLFEADLSYGT